GGAGWGGGNVWAGPRAGLLEFAGFAAGADLAPPPHPAVAFVRHKDIAYRTDPDADRDRHRLDVYCPKGKTDFPVVLFVHGGKWEWGDKNLYAGIGEGFASSGVRVVIFHYRLAPKGAPPGPPQ